MRSLDKAKERIGQMEKIKIFISGTNDEFTELENRINTWFSKNEGITITARQVKTVSTVNFKGEPIVNCTIVIFYQPKA
ncbi:MAG: hypothetical protein A2406_00610 [Candidatus Komeilibacteria bacterium RIFOXYC1_FULL_37_11]|uniref:Sporulation protein Cse60 n=1 Tax=Candidatus Komeilibacteria bacterium RIFOXYC1_FULL_37_11 TaxID=1798555 RepID=A0A1G2BZ60_9BACT|nr:MAG: hypothetical protein A2406_00610 [Candidatus Komeilibacteria bacterium RIFOXYC1_FULL_37_11]OGY95988.1 MAG: hypothetical protein A2611_04220 [Candidatus Komeilibacteria bacterium RIFOXYD1_FULL_37_29]